jgi:prevent-host-death family protein
MATTEITATNVRRQFASILETVEVGGRVVVTRHGKAIAAFIGPSDIAALGITVDPVTAPETPAQTAQPELPLAD